MRRHRSRMKGRALPKDTRSVHEWPMRFSLYQIDAFAGELFRGNPAAVTFESVSGRLR